MHRTVYLILFIPHNTINCLSKHVALATNAKGGINQGWLPRLSCFDGQIIILIWFEMSVLHQNILKKMQDEWTLAYVCIVTKMLLGNSWINVK